MGWQADCNVGESALEGFVVLKATSFNLSEKAEHALATSALHVIEFSHNRRSVSQVAGPFTSHLLKSEKEPLSRIDETV